jgi:hypothetical protein
MSSITRWILPIALVGIGIAIFAGFIMPTIPMDTGLRPMIAMVVILLGIHRFAAARVVREDRRRRFGGNGPRPWERP